MEDLHRGQQVVGGDADHVGVGSVAEHHRLLLHRPAQRAEVVTKPGGLLEVELAGGGRHLALQPADQRISLAGHEIAEAVDDLAMFLGRDRARARGGALADVAQ